MVKRTTNHLCSSSHRQRNACIAIVAGLTVAGFGLTMSWETAAELRAANPTEREDLEQIAHPPSLSLRGSRQLQSPESNAGTSGTQRKLGAVGDPSGQLRPLVDETIDELRAWEVASNRPELAQKVESLYREFALANARAFENSGTVPASEGQVPTADFDGALRSWLRAALDWLLNPSASIVEARSFMNFHPALRFRVPRRDDEERTAGLHNDPPLSTGTTRVERNTSAERERVPADR